MATFEEISTNKHSSETSGISSPKRLGELGVKAASQGCQPSSSLPTQNVDQIGARDFLSKNHWPVALQDAFLKNLQRYPIRFFICDDSGSMITADGQRVVNTAGNKKRGAQCSRWLELTESLRFHVDLAQAAHAPSEFRLLNQGLPCFIGTPTAESETAKTAMLNYFQATPGGGTPLCQHIRHIVSQIQAIEATLRANAQKAVVIIATDGESSDGDVAVAMKPLETLPVWVVVRLCTDEEKVVNYWNRIDSLLEVDMDVIDDFTREAAEVAQHNPWLTYGEPIHRMREFGINMKEFDLLDESKLSYEHMRSMCHLLLGGELDEYPFPDADWKEFYTFIKEKAEKSAKTWSPVTSGSRPWIEVAELKKQFKKPKCLIM